MFREICFQSDVSLTGTRLQTQPDRIIMTVCSGGYVVLNCSVQSTSFLVWTMPTTQGRITCDYTEDRSLCMHGTRTSYAVSRGRQMIITSLLTIIDINSNMRVNCLNQSGIQKKYFLRQGMYVTKFLLFSHSNLQTSPTSGVASCLT